MLVTRTADRLSWVKWGIGAAGSAFEWHSKGRGFESHMLHEKESFENTGFSDRCRIFEGFFVYEIKKMHTFDKNIWTFSDFWCMIKEIMMIMKEELTGWQDWGFGS